MIMDAVLTEDMVMVLVLTTEPLLEHHNFFLLLSSKTQMVEIRVQSFDILELMQHSILDFLPSELVNTMFSRINLLKIPSISGGIFLVK